MQIGELFVKIGIKGGKESVATMTQLKATTLATKAALIGAVVAFAKMSQEARKLAMQLDVFEKTTGLSGDSLQKLSYRAAAAGVSLDGLDGTLQSIQQRVTDISLGQGDIYPFQMWGIGLNRDPIKVLDQIAAKLKVLQKQSPAMAAKMASDFGLSNSMVYMLLTEQTEELNKQFILKGKDKEALVQLNREWYKLLWYVKQIAIRSQGFLSHIALPIVKACVSIVKSFGEMLITASELVRNFKWLKSALVVIGLVIAAAAAYFFPITAALIAIALIVEDIYGYMTGKDSITGRMIEWIKSGQIIKDIFMTIAETIRTISDLLFGSKFTQAVADLLHGVSESIFPDLEKNMKEASRGKSKTAKDYMFKPFGSMPSMFDFAKPNIAGNKGGVNIVQHNTAEFVARSAAEDGEAAGEMFGKCAWSNAGMQNPELAHSNP
jgi:hypothetical protein